MTTTIANPVWNPWANDARLLELYRKRCRRLEPEMTAAAQAARILGERIERPERLLDAGCGGGYYYWSLHDRRVPIEYVGLDYTPQMVELARQEMPPAAGLAPEAFRLGAIEDLDEEFDDIICFHVLTNSPHYALPLERLLRSARKRVLIRENLGASLAVRFTPDANLDEGKQHIRVYHNTYPLDEVIAFIRSYGFRVTRIRDDRSGDGVEDVVGVPHTWRILLAER